MVGGSGVGSARAARAALLMSAEDTVAALIAVGRAFHARGWAPATAGNYSARLPDGRIAITVSGAHKGRLSSSDIMELGADHPGRPSAETALHLAIYRRFPDVGSVLHSHGALSVALGRVLGDAWVIEGHELAKAFPGIASHDQSVAVPIVENSQDMAEIEAAIMPRLASAPAYLIRGHGLYAWGRDVAEAERVVEALEWLAEAELAERSLRACRS